MSNGYTHIIGTGATFREFATRCVRAMTPCIKQRDESLDSPPRLQDPDTEYADEQIRTCRERLDKLEKMSQSERDEAARAEFSEGLDRWQKRVEETAALRSKYEAMIAAVKAWKAPTPDHEGVRSFMIGQIEDSIRFDCVTWDPPTPLTGEEWFAERIASATSSLAHAIESRQEELSSTAKRNAWLKAFLESLPAD